MPVVSDSGGQARSRGDDDRQAIDALVALFFRAFANRDGPAMVPSVRTVALPQALVIKNVGDVLEVYTLEEFIAPRETLLSNGELVDFVETETSSRTEVWGNIAQRASLYSKSGVLRGAAFESRGVKIFQFVRTALGWRISAVAWDDQRDGFTPPEHLSPGESG